METAASTRLSRIETSLVDHGRNANSAVMSRLSHTVGRDIWACHPRIRRALFDVATSAVMRLRCLCDLCEPSGLAEGENAARERDQYQDEQPELDHRRPAPRHEGRRKPLDQSER